MQFTNYTCDICKRPVSDSDGEGFAVSWSGPGTLSSSTWDGADLHLHKMCADAIKDYRDLTRPK